MGCLWCGKFSRQCKTMPSGPLEFIQLSSRLEKPRSREPSQPALSYEQIENFTKDLEVRRDLGNRAHVKRPLKQNKIYNWSTPQPVPLPQAYKIHQIINSIPKTHSKFLLFSMSSLMTYLWVLWEANGIHLQITINTLMIMSDELQLTLFIADTVGTSS